MYKFEEVKKQLELKGKKLSDNEIHNITNEINKYLTKSDTEVKSDKDNKIKPPKKTALELVMEEFAKEFNKEVKDIVNKVTK